MSILECKALCMVINILVLHFIFLSSSRVHFMNCLGYLTMSNSTAISWLVILIVCIKVFSSFSFFGKFLGIIHVYKVIDFFLAFC